MLNPLLVLTLVALVSATGCALAIPSDVQYLQDMNSNDAALRAGAALLHTHGVSMVLSWLGLGLVSFLGAAVVAFRRPRAGRPPLPPGEKAIPITIKIRPDLLDKLRVQATEAGIGYQTLINRILEHATE